MNTFVRHRRPRVVRHVGGSGGSPGEWCTASAAATTADRSNGGAAPTILLGSGADDVIATVIPPVTRSAIANDALNAAAMIGNVLVDRSDILPPGQVYRGSILLSPRAALDGGVHPTARAGHG